MSLDSADSGLLRLRTPLPVHLCHTKALSLQGRQPHRPGGDMIADRTDTCMQRCAMQRCAMQRIALAKLKSLVKKGPGFTLEPIVNFKFRLIHHYLPARRRHYAILK